eukprot:s1439_g1.t1
MGETGFESKTPAAGSAYFQSRRLLSLRSGWPGQLPEEQTEIRSHGETKGGSLKSGESFPAIFWESIDQKANYDSRRDSGNWRREAKWRTYIPRAQLHALSDSQRIYAYHDKESMRFTLTRLQVCTVTGNQTST